MILHQVNALEEKLFIFADPLEDSPPALRQPNVKNIIDYGVDRTGKYVSCFLGYGMTAARYFRVQMPLFVLVTGSSAIACFWLIPTQGVLGAAIALIVGAIVQAVFSLGVIVHALYRLDRYQGTKSNID
jgi:hypothetical protein